MKSSDTRLQPMTRDIVVIGASSGGVVALKTLFSALPKNFPAALLAVLHVGTFESLLPDILSWHCELPASHAIDGEKIEVGRIYVAPPDRHLLVNGEFLRVHRGPMENFSRPAIDPLFRSAAYTHRKRVIGVILTGNLDDGVSGLWAVKKCGGITIVQDPSDALFPNMPLSTLENVNVDHCLPLSQIAPALLQIAGSPVERIQAGAPSQTVTVEGEIDISGVSSVKNVKHLGNPSSLTCPQRHGVLWEVEDEELLRYRCHVGHAFSAAVLSAAREQEVENALWMAIRCLEEKEIFSRTMAERARKKGKERMAEHHDASANATMQHARVLREILDES